MAELMADLQILYHGNCLDGVSSAAIFTRFYREVVAPGAAVRYRGMAHGPADPFGPDQDATFDAPVNAVMDFRYCASDRLHWWCDHHATTWVNPEDEAHFLADESGQKHFDPAAPSCAGLLARWLSREHGFDAAPLEPLVRWADLVDSASFESPRQAVALEEPAIRLAMLLESAPPDSLVDQLIAGLTSGDLEAVHDTPEVQAALEPVVERHWRAVELFKERMTVDQGVAVIDLSADGVEGFNKFIPYHLSDGLRYTVVLTSSDRRTKVSVGSNPWERPDPLHHIGELCRKYGGGGHPVVGAVTLPVGELERARVAFEEIQALLKT